VLVCHCNTVYDSQLLSVVRDGTTCVDQIAAVCGAGARCGGCRVLIEELVDTHRASDRSLVLRSA
jgi:bacterioferritin-associated ferredoxin